MAAGHASNPSGEGRSRCLPIAERGSVASLPLRHRRVRPGRRAKSRRGRVRLDEHRRHPLARHLLRGTSSLGALGRGGAVPRDRHPGSRLRRSGTGRSGGTRGRPGAPRRRARPGWTYREASTQPSALRMPQAESYVPPVSTSRDQCREQTIDYRRPGAARARAGGGSSWRSYRFERTASRPGSGGTRSTCRPPLEPRSSTRSCSKKWASNAPRRCGRGCSIECWTSGHACARSGATDQGTASSAFVRRCSPTRRIVGRSLRSRPACPGSARTARRSRPRRADRSPSGRRCGRSARWLAPWNPSPRGDRGRSRHCGWSTA